MSQIINEFEILKGFKEEMKNSIKTLFIFNNVNEVHPYNNNGKNAIIILKNDEVLAFGNNSLGCLGFGDNTPVWRPKKVRELSDKRIVSLHNGLYHVIAVNDKHEVYVWGSNSLGQLGNGKTQSNFHTPELNHYLIGKSIAQICCGDWHSLALTSFGDVYAWGDNQFGQIGIESERECEPKPVKLNSFSGQKIISISCGSMHSMALSENGIVFSWGYNKYGQLGIGSTVNSYRPKIIQLNNSSIKKISCGQKHSFLLSSDGYIYVFGKSYLKGTKKNQKIPIKLNNSNKFIDIVSHISYSLSVAITNDEICYVFGKIDSKKISIPLKTNFTSIINYYATEWQITFETLHFSEKSMHPLSYLSEQKVPFVSSIRSSHKIRNNSENEGSNDQSLEHTQNIANMNKTERQFSSDGRYKNDFEELGHLGKGSFGSVYKVKHKLEEQIYAVKKMQFQGLSNEKKDMGLKELKLMAKLQSDFVVQYKTSWFENNNTLYIQMEYCLDTLKNKLVIKKKEFNRKDDEIITPTEFYISNELLREILESVNYLHKHNPPIIHRDLKPANILITSGINGRFLKIADFGLATLHDNDRQTHTQELGTFRYTAPEVMNSPNYDMKSDVFSLGVIAQDLFDIDIYSSMSSAIFDEPNFEKKYKLLIKTIIDMLSHKTIERPNCSQLLSRIDSWAISYDELKKFPEFTKFNEQTRQHQTEEDNFYQLYLRTKLNLIVTFL